MECFGVADERKQNITTASDVKCSALTCLCAVCSLGIMLQVTAVHSSDDLQDNTSVMDFQAGRAKHQNHAGASSHLARNGSYGVRTSSGIASSSGDSVTTASKERTVDDEDLSREAGRLHISNHAVPRDSDSGLPPSASSSFETPNSSMLGSTADSGMDPFLSGSHDNLLDEVWYSKYFHYAMNTPKLGILSVFFVKVNLLLVSLFTAQSCI